MRKLTVVYIFNNVLVYVVAMSLPKGDLGDGGDGVIGELWFQPAGLAEQAMSQVRP